MNTATWAHEADFEEALIHLLTEKGWEKTILRNCREKDLLQNWANILFDNNRNIDRLNNYPLTDSEMQAIMEQITTLRTPLKLNGFINGKTVSIIRDNPDDKAHFGKKVSLKIYDRHEIAAGKSRYQIAQQPVFPNKSSMLNDRRGDLMLLINGMPLIHIELKRSGIPASQACNQIEKYAHEGVFTGLFSLVQIFVAMNPDEAVYFANPGPDGRFNSDYYFHWADFNNEVMNDWKSIASFLLSIPMAHQLIGFYTVADHADGVLKVMRSYQYYAANAISDKVSKTDWTSGNQRGGYIWHTTGSGKTMTSFKSAQLIANSDNADKVVFLTDRIELGTQSLKEYRAFAEDSESVQATENTYVLLSKLKSSDPADTLIVTSIQKMSNIKAEDGGLNALDLEKIRRKRVVFIVDEAHRSTFGDMLITIKGNFPDAIFFGFTGTPIHDENQKKMNTTSTVFGNELHRYSIADGIRDRNVLGFDPYKVLTFKDKDIRKAVALKEAMAGSEDEIFADPAKEKLYYKYMDPSRVPMAGYRATDGSWVKGIEDYLPNAQYLTPEHQNNVVEDICENWKRLSRNGKFHAIFATSSIPEAIQYYRLLKEKMPALRSSCLFDPNIDNNGDAALIKEDGLVEILSDYNARYGQDFSIPTHALFKKDLAMRLAHKEAHKYIDRTPEKQVDLLIVVDQMLTGFDSKWVNTLYLDKMLEYENIIQAFSRTNRLFGLNEKPFGTIRYYRRPHSMERNIEAAVKLYSGDKPIGLFVCKLQQNLRKLNEIFTEIRELFSSSGVADFMKLPEDSSEKAKFAKLFKDFNAYLEAAKIQGLRWDKTSYAFGDDAQGTEPVELCFDEGDFLTLAQRYKELSRPNDAIQASSDGAGPEDLPFDLVGYLTEIDTGLIDAHYMQSRFEKYLKLIKQENVSEEAVEKALTELNKSFAALSQEDQRYASLFLHEIQRGDAEIVEGRTLRDYINERKRQSKAARMERFAATFGLDPDKLQNMLSLNLNEGNLNEFGRFDELKATLDKAKVQAYFVAKTGAAISQPKANIKMDALLRSFILSGGFEI